MNIAQIMNNLNKKVCSNYDLTQKHNFFKPAGKADFYYNFEFTEDMNNDLNILHELYKENYPFKIFGKHTNLYITEKGYRGLFVDISEQNGKIDFDEKSQTFTATANCYLTALMNYGADRGYDFSCFAGIPGLVGSAIVGNVSWRTKSPISEFLTKIYLYNFETGEEECIIPSKEIFDIRNSFIKKSNLNKTKYMVLRAEFKTAYIGKENVKKLIKEQLDQRAVSLKEGFGMGTAGSFWSNGYIRKMFGNSNKFTYIVKELGLDKLNINGAGYTPNNNFLKTEKQTKDKDVAKLLKYTFDETKKKFGFELSKEVIILDYDGEIDIKTFFDRYSN